MFGCSSFQPHENLEEQQAYNLGREHAALEKCLGQNHPKVIDHSTSADLFLSIIAPVYPLVYSAYEQGLSKTLDINNPISNNCKAIVEKTDNFVTCHNSKAIEFFKSQYLLKNFPN